MAKQYKGSLTLEWFNKQKAIINLDENSIKSKDDIPASKINWINKEESLFYELNEEEGKGFQPFWVNKNDLRVKEARPLIFQNAFKAILIDKPNTIPGTSGDYILKEIKNEEDAIDIENILIKGDNLLALNSLKKHFDNLPDNEKVKCIFIDPPYNTGEAFGDNYDDNLQHSQWLTLIRDRIKILYQLLKEDGSIWITVDDKESHYLKVLCDDIFGRDNFIANLIWEKRTARDNRKSFSANHDHILVYAKTPEFFKESRNKLPLSQAALERYKNPDNDPRGLWQSVAMTAQAGHGTKSQFYELTTPTGAKHSPPSGLCWIYTQEKYIEQCNNNNIYFPRSGDGVPRIKRFLDLDTAGLVPETIWLATDAGTNDVAKKHILKLFPNENSPFETPKPEELLQRILEISTNPGDIVLDIFGGSGTTFSTSNKMKRKWIGVEIGNSAEKFIIPRMKKVIVGDDNGGISKTQKWSGGGSFKYYNLGKSIINIDNETGKGEFNWKLGKQFIQESILVSYDFVIQNKLIVFPAQIFKDDNNPTVGKIIGKNGKSIYGIAFLVAPGEGAFTISNEEIKTIYNVVRKQEDFQSLVIYTNKGIDIVQDAIPIDMDIIKVPHAIFAELER